MAEMERMREVGIKILSEQLLQLTYGGGNDTAADMIDFHDRFLRIVGAIENLVGQAFPLDIRNTMYVAQLRGNTAKMYPH